MPGAGWFCKVPGAVFEAEAGAGQRVPEGTARVVVEEYLLPQQHEQVLRELTDAVRESADALRQGGGWTGGAGLEAVLALDAAMARRGVRVRAVYPRGLLAVPRHAAHLRQVSDAGVSVRVLDHVPHDLLVFDGQTACLTSGQACGADEAGAAAGTGARSAAGRVLRRDLRVLLAARHPAVAYVRRAAPRPALGAGAGGDPADDQRLQR